MSSLERNKEQEVDEILEDEEGAIRLGDIYIPPPYKPSTKETENRLIMDKIVVKNFKSFYGEVELGPFHTNFTSIIGPNGSGKSNVIDALMFVFGSRANRIRSKKLSTLIHDSFEHKCLKSCSVAMYFKEMKQIEKNSFSEVPDSEIVITRTALKDNSSFYMLNNEKVLFKTILALLKKRGIDLDHNRFLILQGEVEQISMMRYKGRNPNETGMLEYLEDIIGTSRYNIVLKKLEMRIGELETEQCSKRDHLDIVEKEMSDSKKPRDNAVAYYRLENEIAHCKNGILRTQLYKVEGSLKKLEEKNSVCANEISDMKKQNQTNETIKNKLDSEQRELKKRTNQFIAKLNSLDEEFNKANDEDNLKGEESKAANKNRKLLKDKIQQVKLELEKTKQSPKDNKREIDEFERKIKILKIKMEKETQMLDEHKSKINETTEVLVEERQKYQAELKPLKQKYLKIKDGYNILESQLKLHRSKRKQRESNVDAKKNRLKNAERYIEEKNSMLNELKDTIQNHEIELGTLQPELQSLKLKEKELNSDIHKNNTLLNEYQDLNRHRSRGRVLDFLIEKRKQGQLDGLYGRLGDLGGIDKQYDVAISTACGALDNILVEDILIGQKCVELLRQYNVGRATFIALDKQQHFWEQIRKKFYSPENLPRLFDLVRVEDERIRPALYYALRDTLVAKDLDQAARVAYGQRRYRVVTLQGELIEMTGTLSGGGNRPRRGLMGEKVSERTMDVMSTIEIENVEQERTRLEEALQQCLQRYDFVAQRINEINQSLRRDKQKHTEILRVIKPIIEECKMLSEELQCVETKVDEDELPNLEAAVENKKKELDEMQLLVDEVETKLNACKVKIDACIGSAGQSKQTKVNNLKKEIKKCENNITRLNIAIKNNDKKVHMLNEQINVMEADVEKCKTLILTLHGDRNKLEEIAAKILQEKEDLQQKVEESKKTLAEISAKIKALNKEDTKFRSKLMELENEHKKYQEKMSILSREIASCKHQIKKLVLNDSTLTETDPESFKIYTEEELAEIEIDSLKTKITTAEKTIKTQNLEPNVTAIEMYKAAVSRHEAALEDVARVKKQLDETNRHLKDLEGRRLHEFMIGFTIISNKVKEYYRILTTHGDAELELVDPTNPFTGGIKLNVRPPKKSWKTIMNLSGGEKTLASLAFVFALHVLRPSPLYLMDEIDAALDARNVEIVGRFIRLCDRYVGIYKTDDCSGCLNMWSNEEMEQYFRELLREQINARKSNDAEISCTLESGKELILDILMDAGEGNSARNNSNENVEDEDSEEDVDEDDFDEEDLDEDEETSEGEGTEKEVLLGKAIEKELAEKRIVEESEPPTKKKKQ